MKMNQHSILKWAGTSLAVITIGGSAFGALTPITFAPGSFNADVVVERGVPCLGTNTTATTDGGTNDNGNSWYEIGYTSPAGTFGPGGAGSGVPHAGTILTNVSDLAASSPNPHIYQLAPSWTAPNAILIDSGILRTQAVVTFGGPVGPFTSMSFLVASGNGGGNVNLKIYHSDGTVENNTVACSDWFNGSNPAFSARGRINVTGGSYDTQTSITSTTDGYGNPRWYSRDITLTDTGSPVTNVTCSYGTGGGNVHNQIYAISGLPSGGTWQTLNITGYTDDLIVESNGVPQGPTISPFTGTNATSQSMDSDVNTGNSWYEQGYYGTQTRTGIPHAGSLLTNSTGDHIFQFAASYEANDAFYLDASNLVVSADLAVPTNFTLISVLNSSGNGPVAIGVVLYHEGGNVESNNISSLDWFNGANAVYSSGGRVAVDTSVLNNQNFPFAPNSAPYIYENDILLSDTTDYVTNITMYYLTNNNGNGRTAIFAVSGTQGAALPLIGVAPAGTNVWPVVTGSNAPVVMSAQVTGIAPITYLWQEQVGSSWVTVNNGAQGDGSSVSGATTTTLTINNETTVGTFNYQLIAHNAGGSVTSTPPATVVVLSPLADIPQSGDPGTGFPTGSDNEPNEGHEHAYDHLVGGDPGKYLNFGVNDGQPFLGPVGFTVTPSAGYSVISGMRLHTANDTPGRDPIDVELYGSSDGGHTYTLITSNSLALSNNRNAQASEDIAAAMLGDALQQVMFPNTKGYFTYKVQFTNVKTPASVNSMQIGEVELLGYATNAPAPSIQAPSSVVAYLGSSGVSFAATISPNGYTINSTVWQVQSNGNYVNLSDNANVSGSQTASLTLNNVPFGLNLPSTSLPATYNLQLTLTSTGGAVTSAPVTLTVISAVPNVLSPNDNISDFGNSPVGTGNNAATVPADAIDGTLVTYINTGVGPSAAAGFAPFQGPCGLIDTPAFGPSIISGIRFFSGSEGTVNDPINYTLEGSPNSGTGGPFFLIGPATNSLSLPTARNANSTTAVDPTQDPMQEIDFLNSTAYQTYRVTFHDIVDDSTGVNVDIAELQLLGYPAQGTMTVTYNQNAGTLTISSTTSGTVVNTTNLVAPVWVPVGPISPTSPFTVTVQPGVHQSYYKVQAVAQ